MGAVVQVVARIVSFVQYVGGWIQTALVQGQATSSSHCTQGWKWATQSRDSRVPAMMCTSVLLLGPCPHHSDMILKPCSSGIKWSASFRG
jgi:hypothetical protein